MNIYRVGASSLASSVKIFMKKDEPLEDIPIGEGYVMDLDAMEEKWFKHGFLLFSYQYDVPLDISVDNTVYYIISSLSDLSQIPLQWYELEVHNGNDTYTDSLTRPFLFLFKKRFMQRLRTRKIIKEYRQEAKRRSIMSSKDCEEEILLTMLERVMPIKKGEEIYWFRDYEQTLLEEAIEETKKILEYKFRPGNEGFLEAAHSFEHSVAELLMKQSC